MELNTDPFIFKLAKAEFDINDIEFKVIQSTTINQPLLSLGYHYFMNRTRNDMINYTKNIKSDTKFYFVMNPFELNIANHEENVNKMTNIYLNSKKPVVFNRSFYKTWEILYLFELSEKKDMNMVSIDKKETHIPLAFTSYKDKLEPSKYNVYELNEDFRKNTLKIKGDLIIANCKLNILPELQIYQEQYMYELILSEIITSLKLQEDKGHFVLRVFDTLTFLTIKLIYMVSSFYDSTYLYKPYFSRQTSSEKYIIFKNFKGVSDKVIKSLEKMQSDIIDKYIFDFMPNIILPSNYIKDFTFINIHLANPQQIMMNKIITFIKENNYYGDKYHKNRELQIQATKWWVKMFYAPSNNIYEQNKKELLNLLKTTNKTYELKEQQFTQNLV
jgi:23S rRNA U2552 (ribose-2'-O)-methylase RlmE/FtsJ